MCIEDAGGGRGVSIQYRTHNQQGSVVVKEPFDEVYERIEQAVAEFHATVAIQHLTPRTYEDYLAATVQAVHNTLNERVAEIVHAALPTALDAFAAAEEKPKTKGGKPKS